MSGRVLPFRRLAKAGAGTANYPIDIDGVSLVKDGDGWIVGLHERGRSVSMRLPHGELMRLGLMIEHLREMEER